uniref:Lon proteolytic domain-containing protein n=1 Tax=Globodera rostochiensis TaxID=31243 RepID=A0A914I2L3_GLORO
MLIKHYRRAYRNALRYARRYGPGDFAQMRFVVCAPPHESLMDGQSVTAAAIIGIMSIATGRRVQAKYAVTGSVGETGRLQKIGGLLPKTEAAIAAEKTDIVMPDSHPFVIIKFHVVIHLAFKHKQYAILRAPAVYFRGVCT